MMPPSWSFLALLFIAMLHVGCVADEAPRAFGSHKSSLVCSGRQDVELTKDYEGAHEESLFGPHGQTLAIAHAAALEVVRDAAESTTRFAAG